MRSFIFAAAAALLGFAHTARGSMIFYTPPGAINPGSGRPVDAMVEFDLGTDGLTVTITNLLSDTRDASQNVSGAYFQLLNGSTPITAAGSISSSSGQELTLAGAGAGTLGSVVSTGWALDSNYHLNVLGTLIGPAHTIIGSGPFSNPNGSLTNAAHNPFLTGAVSFDLFIPGVTPDTAVYNLILTFGTTARGSVNVCLSDCGGGGGGGGQEANPEPASWFLLGGGLAVLFLRRGRV